MIINAIHHKLKYRKTNPHSRSVWQILHLDPTLLLLLTMLILFGFAILYSASMQHVQRIIRELTHIGLAFAVMFFLAQIPPHVYRRWSPWLYTLGIILLLVVLIMGQIHKGAQRW